MSFISVPAAGTPLLRDTPQQIDAVSRVLAAGTGPIAIDTERASAYRYDDRAFLIQLRRHGSGTFLIDPEAEPQATRRMAEVVNEAEWVLHAAHTDLPCLMALGWRPQVLHDTQIAGQLLGAERIGLSGMLEAYFDIQVPKDKGNADWSRRPLTQAMLNYAALDVEWLLELLDCCLEELAKTGRTEWYIQECQHVLASASPLSANDWTDLKGLSSLRRALPRRIAHDLWESRDAMARRGDISPESILRSRDLVDIAGRAERDRVGALQQLNSCLHRSRARMKPRARRHMAEQLSDALMSDTQDIETQQFHPPHAPSKGIPDYRTWPDEYPVAAAYSDAILTAADNAANILQIRLDTIVTRRNLRQAAWSCWLAKDTNALDIAEDPIAEWEQLLGETWTDLGLRPWQVELLLNAVAPAVVEVSAT
ncbi:ribonuclease D [Corynebacterium jeikeium]|uniref:ribonuclease D n=1 Tax=Corynebacterium jeikeium TaxID=38289 RepID=UPI00054E69DC|nr:ribonuclease D [Corynebacterium jeikeium]